MTYTDAHIHITQIKNWKPITENGKASPVCACAHSPQEWLELTNFAKASRENITVSFGIHPQNPNTSYIEALENILKTDKKSDCIGEAGFDLFNAEYKKTVQAQTEVWNAQLELCKNHNLPLIVHCRHSLDKIFADTKKLSQIPSVIFHSFPGSPIEAESIIRRNINAHFSFGKPILNGNKNAIKCVIELPLEWILAETDAPYQTLKGENTTPPRDIINVYKKIAELRCNHIIDICNTLEINFYNAFCVLN